MFFLLDVTFLWKEEINIPFETLQLFPLNFLSAIINSRGGQVCSTRYHIVFAISFSASVRSVKSLNTGSKVSVILRCASYSGIVCVNFGLQ